MLPTKVTVSAGALSTELRRPLKSGRGLDPELFAAANEIISQGREVVVRTLGWRRVAPGLLAIGLAAGSVPLFLTGAGGVGFAAMVTAIGLFLYTLAGWTVPPTVGSNARLTGRRVTGAHRASLRLWRRAIREVKAGKRTADDLSALHAQLVVLAEAEDRVDRILARTRYQLDQSEVEAARLEVAVAEGQAEALLGLPPELPPVDYRANRWAESVDVPEPEPTNPQDLR
nr:hypothetical protein [Propionicimonas sp.]